jgi:hypothetical protein
MSNFDLPPAPTVPLQPQQPKRRFPIWLIVLLGIIGFIIFACVGLYLLGSSPQVQQALREQETATVATATADAQEVEQLTSSAKTTFEETFDNNDAGINLSPNDMGQASISDGVYTFTYITDARRSVYVKESLTNFIAEVECSVIKGSKDGFCGIVFDVQETESKDSKTDHYWFFVHNGKYGIETRKGSSNKSFEKSNSAVKSGDSAINRLKVIRVNNDTRYYVNDVLVDRITDSTLKEGGYGFQTGADEKGVQVQVDNLKVQELP